MKTNLKFLSITMLVLVFLLGVTGVAFADEIFAIPLHNNVADAGTDCPDDGGTYWHFVVSPNNDQSAFIVFHLNLGDSSTYDTALFVKNGDQWDNVFVSVPAGKTLQSLLTEGSSAEIIWQEKGPQPDSFKLSHVCVGNQPKDLTVVKTANPSFTRTYGWSIDKTADYDVINTADSATFLYTVTVTKNAGSDSDFALAGDITVSNPNDFDVEVNVADGACAVDDVTLNVPANGSISTTYSCSFDTNPGSGTNVATVTWADFGSPSTSATGTADYVFGDPTSIVNNSVHVTDTNGSEWDFTESGFVTYPMTYTDPAGTCTEHENIVTMVGDNQITLGGDNEIVKVCVGADLTVEKDATPSFTRTYTWDISKDVDQTFVQKFSGSATFNYTVQAWNTGYADSNWALTGTITVTNPNDWEDVVVNLTDSLPECTLDAASVTVPASDHVEVGYSCSMASGAAGENVATANWDKALFFTPNASASGSAAYAFETPTTEVNKSITVTDTFNGSTSTLGTVEFPGPASFSYARTIAVPTWNCVSYTNVAEIIETGEKDSETVTVCGPIKTGALTMGFWQNKNGQGIIKAGASTAGVCNSGTWLRQFSPFQNLSATASCSTVATYVTNAIKAANASGASMNAMLKGQMLATALDVYFSDPALGGNKIGAPTPIGGVMIDLTKICTDMTCSAFENSSSVFGGSPRTVLQMLSYAASQSNAGGTTWYGNVKATQELAKDAFDAINNEKVFAPAP
jgi:hypothetical protein